MWNFFPRIKRFFRWTLMCPFYSGIPDIEPPDDTGTTKTHIPDQIKKKPTVSI
jgi:hypothetical protein